MSYADWSRDHSLGCHTLPAGFAGHPFVGGGHKKMVSIKDQNCQNASRDRKGSRTPEGTLSSTSKKSSKHNSSNMGGQSKKVMKMANHRLILNPHDYTASDPLYYDENSCVYHISL